MAMDALYGGSPWMPPAFDFYRQMTGPDYSYLASAPGMDTAASSQLYGNVFGNTMYGGGTEAATGARAGGYGRAAAGGAKAGTSRRLEGGSDLLDLANAFAQTQGALAMARTEGEQAKQKMIADYINAYVLGPMIQGSQSNLFSQLLSGGQPLGQGLGFGGLGTLGGLNPSGGGLTGWLGLTSLLGGGGAGAGAAAGAGALGAAGAGSAGAAGALEAIDFFPLILAGA